MKIKGITTSESLQRLLAWFLIFLFVYTAVSKLLEFGKMIWPRRMIKSFGSGLGLYLLITARKSE